MSTTGDIELVPSEEDRLLEPVQEFTMVDMEPVPSEEDRLLELAKEATTVDIERMPSEEDRLLKPVPELRPPSKHPIFLSHSGAQKNFVEQLCLDLEQQLHHTPFFDKRSDSLPKGEDFAQYIFQAAQQCELAIVVVSEEYFSRSKWPMLELSMLVQSSNRKILPLFFGLSNKEFREAERRERWFQKWDEWAQIDPRVSVEHWKHALRELGKRNGLEFVAALGEVGFRKDVLATVSAILPAVGIELEVPITNQRGVLSRLLFIILKVIGRIIGFIVIYISFAFLFFKIIVPIIKSFVLPKEFTQGFPKGF